MESDRGILISCGFVYVTTELEIELDSRSRFSVVLFSVRADV